jgi:phosphoribosylglycinamide formyltransferase-1
MKIGILGSGRGSNFIAVANAIKEGKIPAQVVLVATDQPDAKILDEAKSRKIKTYVCPPSQFKTKLEPEIETRLAAELKKAGAELIVLAGFMRVIKQPLLQTFPNRIINLHPSLLPKYPGLKAWERFGEEVV